MADKKLRVGIIGMGLYASTDHIPNLRATGRAEVVAASRRDPERLALAKRELSIPETFTNWREMLEQIELDAVVVCTPHNYHLEPTLAALQHGLHVLLEKPLATSIADAHTILKAVQGSDRVVLMGVNRRGDPSWQTAQRALASGEIGQVRQISAVMCTDLRVFRGGLPVSQGILSRIESDELLRTFMLDVPKSNSWRNDPAQMGGDFFTDIGSHLVDVMLWMGGAPAVEVLAYSPKDSPQRAGILTVQALLSNDVVLSITYNDNVAMGDEFRFAGDGQITVLGDKGRLMAATKGFGSGPADDLTIERNGDRHPLPIEGQKITPAAAFVSTILDGAPVIASVEDAANVVALIQSSYRSALERQIVKIEKM